MGKLKGVTAFLAVAVGAGVLTCSFDAESNVPRVDVLHGTFCHVERREFYMGHSKIWPVGCGRQPQAEFLDGLKRDCARTVANIARDRAMGGVGSWVANWSGVYDQPTCLQLDFGGEL